MTAPGLPYERARDADDGGGTGFAAAALALSRATTADADFCGPFVFAFGVTGVAVSTLGEPLGSETLCASDEIAARLNEIQLDLGEGPGWEALNTRRPVLHPDFHNSPSARWPLTWQAFCEAGVSALFAFPLDVADIDVGAVTLSSTSPMSLSGRQVADATILATILARQVLRRALLASQQSEEDAENWHSDFSRREVHQATGMVLAQMRISPDDALMVIRGHAFAGGRPVRDVAADVIARTLDFTPRTDERI